MSKGSNAIETRTEYGIQWGDGSITVVPQVNERRAKTEALRIKATFADARAIVTRTVTVGVWAHVPDPESPSACHVIAGPSEGSFYCLAHHVRVESAHGCVKAEVAR